MSVRPFAYISADHPAWSYFREILYWGTYIRNVDDLVTVHLSINLVNDQLDAQFFYFIIRLLQSSTCFEQRRVHHQEVELY